MQVSGKSPSTFAPKIRDLRPDGRVPDSIASLANKWAFVCYVGVLVIDSMPVGQHALMQDAGNQDAIPLLPVKQDVLAVFVTAQARTDMAARPP